MHGRKLKGIVLCPALRDPYCNQSSHVAIGNSAGATPPACLDTAGVLKGNHLILADSRFAIHMHSLLFHAYDLTKQKSTFSENSKNPKIRRDRTNP